MIYEVILKKPSYNIDNDHYWFQDSLLAPDSDFDSISSESCKELGLCDKCYKVCDQSRKCHIMRKNKDDRGKVFYDKLCPILFCDLVKPPFKPADLI